MGCFSGPDIPVPPHQEPFTFPPFPSFEMPAMEFPEFPAFPAPFDPEVGEAKRRRAEEVRQLKQIEMRRHGYARTILTSGRGVEEEPTVRKPSLLGS